MAAYFLIEVLRIKNEAIYKQYAEAARPVLEKHGGEYLIRSNNIAVVSGVSAPKRVVLVRFPDEQAVRNCLGSPEYRQLSPLREQSTESRAVIVSE